MGHNTLRCDCLVQVLEGDTAPGLVPTGCPHTPLPQNTTKCLCPTCSPHCCVCPLYQDSPQTTIYSTLVNSRTWLTVWEGTYSCWMRRRFIFRISPMMVRLLMCSSGLTESSFLTSLGAIWSLKLGFKGSCPGRMWCCSYLQRSPQSTALTDWKFGAGHLVSHLGT